MKECTESFWDLLDWRRMEREHNLTYSEAVGFDGELVKPDKDHVWNREFRAAVELKKLREKKSQENIDGRENI